MVTAVMQIDKEHYLAVLAWVRTSRFEMTEAMAMEIMRRGFLKVAIGGGHILDTPVSENDFCRLAHSMHIIDATEKTGLAHGKLAIIFGKILKHMPRLRLAREHKRYHDRGALAKARPRKRKHMHKRLVGRSQLAILFEELYRVIPSSHSTYKSPVKLVVSFLETA